MLLHIGNGETVRDRNIIGIFDLDTASVSAATREFLAAKEKDSLVDYGDRDLPRSFLVTDGGTVRLSRISTVGLKARMTAPKNGAEE